MISRIGIVLACAALSVGIFWVIGYTAMPIGGIGAPQYVQAAAISPSKIKLTWIYSGSISGFRLDRDSGSGFVRVATLTSSAREFTDINLYANTGYQYRIAAYKGGRISSYTPVAGTTQPLQPPVVLAGMDRSVLITDTVNLMGSVFVDGMRPTDALTFEWSVIGGTGTVTFAAPNALSTTASFSDTGKYNLRLTATVIPATGIALDGYSNIARR